MSSYKYLFSIFTGSRSSQCLSAYLSYCHHAENQSLTEWPGTGHRPVVERHYGKQCDIICVTVTSLILFHRVFIICIVEPLPKNVFNLDTFDNQKDDNCRKFERKNIPQVENLSEILYLWMTSSQADCKVDLDEGNF